MTDISKDFDTAVETSTKKISETFTSFIIDIAKDQYQKVRLKKGFKNIAEYQKSKCSHVKTLLYRQEPADLLRLYVKTMFKVGKSKADIDDIGIINNAIKAQRYVLTGLPGSGKSVFMKFVYLQLSSRETPFPVFLELRDLNDEESNPSILNLIQKRFASVTGDFTLSQLQYGLRKGVFFLILDAFDELNLSVRRRIEKEILEISETYLKCGLVVSARPSSVFDSWPNFCEATVLGLSESSAAELISKLEFDSSIKDKFISKLPNLYKTHYEFLSNPLLVTMTFLTFDQFADIPNKLHIFYEQAFITLFNQHDALKSGFIRQSYSKLPIDDFRRFLSCFSFITHIDNCYIFDKRSLVKYASKAKLMEKLEVDESLWIKDLTESLCLLIVDGDQISFSHRSFQEYFAAIFVANNNKLDKRIITELILRIDDSVLSIAFALNKEKMETDYIIPYLKKFVQTCKNINIIEDPDSYLKLISYNYQTLNIFDLVSTERRLMELFIILFFILGLYDRRWLFPDWLSLKAAEKYGVGDVATNTLANKLKYVNDCIVDLLRNIQREHRNKKTMLSEIVAKRNDLIPS